MGVLNAFYKEKLKVKTRKMQSKLTKQTLFKLFNKIKKKEGWLAWVDFKIIRTLMDEFDVDDFNVVEIGVHHGKSTLAFLAQNPKVSKTYIIDLFENQKENIDFSGLGNKELFLQNLSSLNVSLSRIKLDCRNSMDVQGSDILNFMAKPHFFHVDGGHNFETVQSDINLGLSTIHQNGIIAVDDVFRPEWPEVSQGVFNDSGFSEFHFVPFAVGFNKTFFCHKSLVNSYQGVLRKDRQIEPYLTKVYNGNYFKALVYQEYPLPEWSILRYLVWGLSLYFPKVYIQLFSKVRRKVD
jgi:hypothetical protein